MGGKLLIIIVLALWLALIVVLGATGQFVRPTGKAPIALAVAAAAPVIVFLLAMRAWPAFRRLVAGFDLPTITAIQAWRFAGLGFVALHVLGLLPGSFAWPAGLGDIAIGLTAPWVVYALIHRRGFAASHIFATWNLLGMLDLIVAVSDGAITQIVETVRAGAATMAPMARMPLVLIPAYFVPLFFMLHLAALFQFQRLRTARRGAE